ncbi:hypothetical protein ABPG74_006730 [Tetrahymena malaccensis]
MTKTFHNTFSIEFTLAVIVSKERESLVHLIEKLNRLDLTFLKDIELTLNNGYRYQNVSKNNQDGDCESLECQEFYELHQQMNRIQQKNNVKVVISNFYFIQCNYHQEQLLTSFEQINTSVLYYLTMYSNKQILALIVIMRIFKGYLFNQTNDYIMSNLSTENLALIQTVYSHIFSIKALEKLYLQHSLNYLPQITYDLYEI